METSGYVATSATANGSGSSDSGWSIGCSTTSGSRHRGWPTTDGVVGGGDIGRRQTSTSPVVRAWSSSRVARSMSTTLTSGTVRANSRSSAGTNAALALG